MAPDAAKRQLEMLWPPQLRRIPLRVRLARGYYLRPWQPGDEAGFLQVMELAGFKAWTEVTLREWLDRVLPDGLPLVVRRAPQTKKGSDLHFLLFASNRNASEAKVQSVGLTPSKPPPAAEMIVACAMAAHRPNADHPFGGELGWVAGDPAHRGKGIGLAVCAAAVRRFLKAGYKRIYLKTDDHRLAAIKVYLRLGFQPWLFQDDMPARWEAVCRQLDWPFTPDQWPRR